MGCAPCCIGHPMLQGNLREDKLPPERGAASQRVPPPSRQINAELTLPSPQTWTEFAIMQTVQIIYSRFIRFWVTLRQARKGGVKMAKDRVSLMTAREAAKYLRVSMFTLSKMESNGGLVPYRTPGGHRRYSLRMLNRYLNNSRRSSRR